ncbi:MAG: MarR family transcriptional regulator [Alphaproteobacteria bacterium]|nr:MAG: MarR family transcriptional regulator [Alphaproteobacteria bacterium]
MPAKHNHTGRSKAGPQFVQLFRFILQSAAWSELSAIERAVYLCLAEIYNGTNNGFLGLSVRNAAAACNINKDTAARALRRLAELGFIERSQAGAFGRKVRHSAEWRLTAYRSDRDGSPASKTFMKWRPA